MPASCLTEPRIVALTRRPSASSTVTFVCGGRRWWAQVRISPERVTITKNRDLDNSYVTIAEFASYDAAMANSNDPSTQQFAESMSKLCDGPPNFYNLDFVHGWTSS